MKVTRIGTLVAVLGALMAGDALAQALRHPSSVQPTAYELDYFAQDEVQPSPSDVPMMDEGEMMLSDEMAYDDCGKGACGTCRSCCDLGDPWKLWSALKPCGSCIDVGGWFSMGYHDEGNGLFNNHPNDFVLHQAWLYVEKAAKTGECCWDWGARFDVLYGVDAQNTQAFGNDPGEWDFQNGFDHGIYGWAIPQLYGEVAYNNLRVKAGHFFTPAAYEVVAAPGNFFYSHAITHIMSEPFTHTGILAEYSPRESVTWYAGWTLGWDSGFDQSNQGNIFLGGVSLPVLCENITFTYIASVGNLGVLGRDAFGHSIVLDWEINDRWEYLLTSDLLAVDSTGQDNFSLVNYLYYRLNDCVSFGTRLEWWRGDDITNFTFADVDGVPRLANPVPPGTHSYYEATFGMNVKPHPNFIVRPEVRHDWAPFDGYDETILGVDIIVLY